MGEKPKYYKLDSCECDNNFGCEHCTCAICGDWLESSDDNVCQNCVDKWGKENG